MKKLLFLMFLWMGVSTVHAATIDTIEVFSNAMQKKIKTVVIQPDDMSNGNVPTVYLLHGYSGNYSNYVHQVPEIKKLVDLYGFLIVCPDGGFSSWYWDVPGDANFQYETFVSKELVSYINANYPVANDRRHRAITGMSMGGHGALYLAIRHQETFGAVGSMAGGVDIRPFPNNWEIAKHLGSYAEFPEKWDRHTVMEQLHLLKPDSMAIYIGCGKSDFFFEVNRKLHERLDYLNIPHHYHIMPGKHDLDYIRLDLPFHLNFFHQFFQASS